MFKIFIVTLFCLLPSMVINAQQRRVKEVTDTVIKINKLVMPVNVTTVTPSFVSFFYPGNNEVYTIDRKEVHKIIYKTGRVEILNNAAFTAIAENAWEAVWLTESRKDVTNLFRLGEIESSSPPSSRNLKAAKRGAIIRLQKRAASMNGTVILVTFKEVRGGYGENPGYLIKGIAYGPEPPDEADTNP